MRRVFDHLTEALTIGGVKATLDRVIDKAKKLADRVDKTAMAGKFRKELEDASDELETIAASIREDTGEPSGDVLSEKAQPKLNKYDPGSLLGWTVHLLDKYGLDDAAEEVRNVSKTVSKAWMHREK